MSKPYSIDLRELAMARLETGETTRAVAAALRVAVSSVIKWAARKRLSGSVAPGKMGGHRPHLISGEHRVFVLGEVARDPNMTLHRLSAALAERGLHVHPASVGRFLHREGKSFKKTVLPAEQLRPKLKRRREPESREAIAELKTLGISSIILTGDAKGVAASVSRELGIEEYFAEVLPDEKSAKIKELQSRGLQVAMVGDGVNDAPALVQADLGVAIGAGTDVAVESADVVLVRSDPRDVAAILGLSRATYRKMVQNLIWATGYNAIAIPMAAGITFGTGFLMTPAVGAVFMSASTIIVALNAQLLRLYRKTT